MKEAKAGGPRARSSGSASGSAGPRALGPDAVLFRDEHFLVIDKPAGIATTSPDGRNCLTWLVQRLDPRAPHTHPSSRLDRDVTGVVIFARTDRAIQHLLSARARGAYQRSYRALVSPPPPREPGDGEGVWAWPIAVDPQDRRHRVALDEGERGERVQEARSLFVVLGPAHGSALLAVSPQTGRTHQIRVHAARAGCPILGDVDYGGASRVVLDDGRVVSAPRVLLHCREVRVPRVEGGEGHRFLAPIPEDFAKTFTKLGGDAALLDA
jgi:23S rRNA pseudouridine1911/1915/1917 synthase